MALDDARGNLRERFLTLRSFPSFAGVDDEGITMLAEHAIQRGYPRGALLSPADRPLDRVWIIRQGRVAMREHGVRLAEVGRPWGAGFMSVLAEEVDGIEVEALEDTLALELPAAGLFGSYLENGSFVRQGLRNLARGILSSRQSLPVDADYELPELGPYREERLTMVQRVLRMRADSPVFRALDFDALFNLASRIHEERIPAGTVLWRAGEPTEFALRIHWGQVDCTAPDGRTARVGAPFTLGGLDQMASRPRAYAAVARTDLWAQRTLGGLFFSVIESTPRSGLPLLRLLAKQRLAYNRAVAVRRHASE
jgi:CRP-like cAMP-binding protein